MKRTCLASLLLLLLTSIVAKAEGNFVPKSFSYQAVGTADTKTLFVYFYEIFDFPEDMKNANLTSTEGLSIETQSGNVSLVKTPTYEHYLQNTRLRLSRAGGVKGTADITVTINFRGESITNTFPVNILGLETSKMTAYIEPEKAEPTLFDVIGNTKFYRDDEPKKCTITIDNASELKYGTATLVYDESKGYNVIQYTPNEVFSRIVTEDINYTITLSDGVESASNSIKTYITKNCFASRIIEYAPAAGQFRTEEAWDNPNIISDKSSSTKGVSLGGLGGYIIYGFDQPIYNNPQNPYGVDFTIKGNSFIAAEKGVWTEPGAVQVMEDLNGDGIPNDGEWYELAGSDYWLSTTKHNVKITYYNPHYNDRYTIPWTMTYEDKNGEMVNEYGALLSNDFHKHSFYPDYFYNSNSPKETNRWYNPDVNRDSISFSGITEIRGCIDMRTPSYIEFYTVAGFGYCDNKGFNDNDLRIALNPYGRPSLGEDANDGMDISWAVDKDGNYVNLEKIDFVKIYTAGNKNAGWLGEWSTEVLNCAITLPDPDYVPKDYYYNYVGITQLQVQVGHSCQYEGFLFKNGRPVKDAVQRWWLTDVDGNSSAAIDAIAEIDNNGLFTAKSNGKVWVHFSAMDGIAQESFEVNVVNLTGVVIGLEGYSSTISDEELQCVVGERVYINVESEDNSDSELNGSKSNRYIYDNYTWINSKPEVGTMNNGSFVALTPGETVLTVVSNTNPSLTDHIKIIVVDVPEIKATPIQITKDSPVGELLNTAIFSAGNNATVYMDEVSALKGKVNVSLYNNHLYYAFNEGEFVTDILKFKVTCYGKVSEIEVPITYGPHNIAGRKKLLMAFNDADVIAGADAETLEVKNYIDNLGENSVDNILVDGSYAYITQGAVINRFDVDWGKNIANAKLTNDTKHNMAVYADKILVTDGNTIKVFYKTDLEAFKVIDLSADAKQMVLNGDVAYVLVVNSDNVAHIDALDLTTWNLTSQNVALQNVHTANAMYFNNGKLYIPVGASASNVATMTVYNTANNNCEVVNSTIQSAVQTNNVSAMAHNNIMVSTGAGFVAFNVETATFATDIVMENEPHMPIYALGENSTYYVAYSNGLKVFDSNDFSTSMSVDATPSVITMMNETAENEAPTVKKVYSVTSGIYERATSVKSCTAAKLSNYFADKEGSTIDNFAMYIREDVDWLDITYAADGKITPKAKFTGDVDTDTDFVFTLECIDKNGASVKSTATLRITPRIYKPLISENEINITSVYDEVQSASLPVSEIFNYSKATSNLSFVTTLTDVSDRVLISNAEIVDNTLIVSALPQMSGIATLTLTQSITHKSYGTKEFTANIPVVVTYDETTGVQNIVVSDICIYYSDGNLTVKNGKNLQVYIYDITGKLCESFVASDDMYTASLNLVEGIYVVKVGETSVKVSVK